MSSIDRLAFALEVKGIDEYGEGTFTGYGSVFHVKDSYQDVVMPGAFSGETPARFPWD
jgi:phage head maturation protease